MFDRDMEIMEEQKTGKSMTFLPLVIIFSLMFSVAAIFTFIAHFVFFKKLKWKPSMLFVVSGIMVLFNIIFYFLLIRNINILDHLIRTYFYINMSLVPIAFTAWFSYNALELKSHPEIKHMHGWAKNFEYSTTPFERMKDNKNRKMAQEGNLYEEKRAPLGVLVEKPLANENGKNFFYYDKPHVLYKYYSESLKHTIMTGTTGSGKSVTMLNQVYNDIASSKPIVFVDCKNSLDIVYFLSKWAKQFGRDFYHFSAGPQSTYVNPYNKNKATYDPLSSGSSDYKTELLLNVRKYDLASDVYKNRATTVLSTVNWLLEQAEQRDTPLIPWDEGGIARVVAALKPDALYSLIQSVKRKITMTDINNYQITKNLEASENLYQSMTKSKDADGLSAQANGYRSSLSNLMLSSYGEWLVGSNSKKRIDLSEIVANPNGPVVLFSLSSLESPDASRMIGSLILGNVSQVANDLMGKFIDVTTMFYIDEIQTMDITAVSDILEKARAAKIGTTLSLQSLEQIPSKGSTEAMVDALLGTCGNFIVHAGSGKDTAERFSKVVGEYKKEEYDTNSVRNSSMFTINRRNSRNARVTTRLVDEWKLLPSSLQSLSLPGHENGFCSTAIYITKECEDPTFKNNLGTLARKFQSIVPNELAMGVPDKFKRIYNSRKNAKIIPQEPRVEIPAPDPIEEKFEIPFEDSSQESRREAPKEIEKKQPQNITKSQQMERTPPRRETLREKYKREALSDIPNEGSSKESQPLSDYRTRALSERKIKRKSDGGLPDLSDL